MTILDIKDYESSYICNNDIMSIFAILNSNENFEAILVNMVGDRHYFISLQGAKLEEESDIPLDDLNIVNKYIEDLGGKDYILSEIKDKYKNIMPATIV